MRRIVTFGLLVTAVFFVGCGNMTKGKTAAAAQVAAFHTQFNAGDLEAIAAGAHPNMEKSSPKSHVTNFIGTVRRKLGKCTDSRDVNWTIRTFNGAVTVVLTQDTTFENGKGSETFTFRIQDEKASLLGYNINSQDLIMK